MTESPSKQNMVTRKAGGQKEVTKEMQVCNYNFNLLLLTQSNVSYAPTLFVTGHS